MPSTMIRPSWCSSRRLMVRMKVDLPEPDGPMITNTSPRRTRRLMPRRAWNSPNHFLTFSQTMMSSPVSMRLMSVMEASTRAHPELLLDPAAGDGHGVADDEEKRRGEQIDLADRPRE